MATKSEIEVKLRLTGQKEFENALKQIAASTDNLGKSFGKFAEEVKKSAQKITILAAAATAASAAIFKFTKNNAEANDNLLDVAEATGVTTQKLQELIFAGESLGVTSDETTGGVLRFANALGDLQRTGGGALATAFEKTDPLFLAQLKTMKDVGRAYDAFIKRAGSAAQSQEGFALISDIVGRKLAVATTQIAKGSKGLDDFAIEAAEVGAVLDEKTLKESEKLVNTLSRMGAVFRATSKLITAEFQPALIKIAESITQFLLLNQKAFVKFAKDFVSKVTKVFTDFFKLWRGQANGEVISPFASALFKVIKFLIEGFVKLKNTVKPVFETIIAFLDKAAAKLGLGQGAGKGLGAGLLIFINLFGGPLLAGLNVGIALFQTLFAVLGALAPTLLLIGGFFTSLLTPMGAVFALIAASVLNVLGFFDNWGASVQSLQLTVTGFFQNFRANLDNLLIGIQVFIGKIKIYLEDIPGFFRDILIPAIVKFFNELPGFILGGFAALSKLIQDFFAQRGEQIKNFFLTVTPLILEAVGRILQGLPGIFAAIVQGTIQLATTLVTTVGPILAELFKKAFDALPGFIEQVFTKGKEIVTTFFAITGPQIVDFLKKSFDTIVPLIGPALQKLGQLILTFFQAALPVVIDLLKKGLENLPTILAAATKLAFEVFKQLIIQLGPVLLKLLWDVLKNLPQIIMAALKATLNAALAIGDTIKNAVLGRDEPVRQLGAPPIQNFAGGGLVSGPGNGTSDSVPLWGSNGEFMVRAAAVKKYGIGFMQALNSGLIGFQKFASGGLVGAADALGRTTMAPAFGEFSGNPAGAGGMSGRPINLHTGGKVFSLAASQDVARALQKHLQNSDLSKSSALPPWHR